MAQTTARIKQKGKHFEILVDLEKALKFKREGTGSVIDFLLTNDIFTDLKQGTHAPAKDLLACFGTEDVYVVAEKIVKNGEILLTQDFRDEERERKFKQIVDFFASQSVDPRTGRPHTHERIAMALEQINAQITNKSIDEQAKELLPKINTILPISIQTKKLRITIPAVYTGQAYGILNTFKESEEWMNDGSLQCIVKVPSGALLNFFDKLNAITHGAALSEELKEEA